MEANYTAPREIGGWQSRAFIAAGVLLGAAVIGGLLLGGEGGSTQFFRSYLVGYFYAICFALGCLGLLMVQHLSGGGWGIAIRRMLEAGAKTLPFFAVLGLPIIFGMHHIYEWTHEEAVAASHILHTKAPYLNTSFWIIRYVIYFVYTIGVTMILTRMSLKQDQNGDPNISDRMTYVSGPALLFFIVLMTFASVDWFMSTEPEWFSTIYGLTFIAQQAVSVVAFMIVAAVALSHYAPMDKVIQPKHLHDLGKFLLAFTMLWAYFSFSQYIIVWAGNLPEENVWYLKRARGPWEYVAWLIILAHFFLPFMILLSRDIKRRAHAIKKIAMFMIVMRLIDAIWFLVPGFTPTKDLKIGTFHLSWLDVVMPIGLFALFVGLFLWNLKKERMIPIHEPHLADALAPAAHH